MCPPRFCEGGRCRSQLVPLPCAPTRPHPWARTTPTAAIRRRPASRLHESAHTAGLACSPAPEPSSAPPGVRRWHQPLHRLRQPQVGSRLHEGRAHSWPGVRRWRQPRPHTTPHELVTCLARLRLLPTWGSTTGLAPPAPPHPL